MNELNQRGANFFKFFSMVLVFGSLLHMYAYTTDRPDILNVTGNWLIGMPKAHIFYYGLGTFAIINMVMNYWINMYKNVKRFDEKSLLFRSKQHKEILLMWFTYLLAGTNFLIATTVTYLALIKINEVSSTAGYVYIPLVGLILLTGIIISLISAIFRK
jgi:hypothetical protein